MSYAYCILVVGSRQGRPDCRYTFSSSPAAVTAQGVLAALGRPPLPDGPRESQDR